MALSHEQLKNIIEAALLAAGEPLSLDRMIKLFDGRSCPDKKELKEVIAKLSEECEKRGIEIKEVASGYRYQVKNELGPWIQKLQEEKPDRYSRATLETLALIAYKQPITRAEIEAVRGVIVSSHIIRSLMEREWIHIVGQKEVPGHPALFATTKQFLDDFNLKSLSQLPKLDEIKDLEEIEKQFEKQLKLFTPNSDTKTESETSESLDSIEIGVGEVSSEDT